MKSKNPGAELILLLLASPIAYLYINISGREPVTKLDKVNSVALWLIFIGWLGIGPSLSDDSVILGNLLVLSFLTLIWLMFWLLPWLQVAVLSLVGLVALIGMFSAESYVGQLLVFLAAMLWALISIGLIVAGDSLHARYWRMHWTNPSPLEEKTGIAMSPYSKPRIIRDAITPTLSKQNIVTDKSLFFGANPAGSDVSSKGHSSQSAVPAIYLSQLRKMSQIELYKLEKQLDSIGKRVFIEQYNLFDDYASRRITKDDAIVRLVSSQVSDKNVAAISLSNAKRIFKEKHEQVALILAALDQYVDKATVLKAQVILNGLGIAQ